MSTPRHGLRFVIGVLLAGALGAGLAHRSAARALSDAHHGAQRSEAVAQLKTLTAAVTGSLADEEALRKAVADWQAATKPGVTQARVLLLSGMRLLASTSAADSGERIAPRRLNRDEKPFFDRAQRLSTAVDSNKEEQSARKAEIEVEPIAGGRLSLAAPIEDPAAEERTVIGMVEIETATPPPPPTEPWLPYLLALLIPLVLVGVTGRLTSRRLVLAVIATVSLGVALRHAPPAINTLAIALMLFVGLGAANSLGSTLKRHRQAYSYIAPAMIGMLVLVFFPFFFGITLSFTDSNLYNSSQPVSELWIGLANYSSIVGDFAIAKHTDTGWVWNYLNFYWTLGFTILWTVTNVTIGVTSGLILALILNTRALAFRPIYRVLLILPWAMPNYITALIWKGMFHRQFGVINQVLQMVGLPAISWSDHVFTSYLTALATNGWLSFPFMMVVSLGALQSIPADLYEAARVDGATRWQQFRAITLPSLRPALVPAVVLSVVWTFNMFNIIFLVTGGEPGGSTEILITQAYKFAFERYRYGYAAAYSTVIFGILLIYGSIQNRISKATEA